MHEIQFRFGGLEESKGLLIMSKKSLQLFRTLWGMPFPHDAPALWGSYLRDSVTAQGFTGIECCSPGPFFSFGHDPSAVKGALEEAGNLKLILQVQTMDYPVVSPNWREHVESLRKKCLQCVTTIPGVMPVLVNCHAGKDSMRLDDALRFFEEALLVEAEMNDAARSLATTDSNIAHIPLVFETHRQRILHSPFRLIELFDRGSEVMKRIKFNADLSHFVLSLERLPSTELDAEFWPRVMEILEQQAHYIHARVGGPQAIQVGHPLAPEVEQEKKAFFSYWEQILNGMEKRELCLALCPEYGPPPYLPTLPGTTIPVADLNDVVVSFVTELDTRLHVR